MADEHVYISKINWLVSVGREDLIDEVADEFERRIAPARVEQAGDGLIG